MNAAIIHQNDAVIIQQAFDYQGSHAFSDMMRLTYQRHASYALAHNFDYWHTIGPVRADLNGGGWCKIELIARALAQGYKFVAWIDADAAIVSGEADLREALPEGKYIGACEHNADWFKLPQWQIPAHYNVGVTYWRNSQKTLYFVKEWLDAYPGDKRWMEQGSFNDLIKDERYAPYFHACDAKYNATVNVNPVSKPVVMGWHGVQPIARRLLMMKATMKDDVLKFRV